MFFSKKAKSVTRKDAVHKALFKAGTSEDLNNHLKHSKLYKPKRRSK